MWSGTVFRYASPEYATLDEFLSGRGSFKADGRWHLKDRNTPAVYTSLDFDTASREAMAKARYYALPAESVLPLVVAAAKVNFLKLMDLTKTEVLLTLSRLRETPGLFGPAEICDLDWRKIRDQGGVAITQEIGVLAYEEGFEGLLVPSAAARDTKGVNLVYFPDRLPVDRKPELTSPPKLNARSY